MLRGPAGLIFFAAALALHSPADAQDTRTAQLEQQRAEKAKHLEPYQPGRLEKILLKVDAENPLQRIAPHNGFFAEYGYSYKPIGSGIGFGGGWRHDLFDRTARVELEAGWSFKNYRLLRADFSLPYLAGDRFEVGIEGTYHHHPQEDFYGLGPASRLDDRVSYLLDNRKLEARAIVRPREWLEIGTRTGLMSPEVGSGKDSAYPSLEQRFTDATAPGLASQPGFTFADLFAQIDYRDEPGNARAGGRYALTLRRMWDSGPWPVAPCPTTGCSIRYGFRTVDAIVQQFVPIFDKKRVFAVQARITASRPDAGSRVPFYLKPTVGGSVSVRSFDDYRFRDDNIMFVNVEYRWEAFGILDMALFTDWGKAVPKASDLDFSDMKHAYGIGFRFNTAKAVFMRFDIATGGGEGIHYVMKFSKMF
jgi:surface antigen Omp85-like protein